jgi:paraquat-inducible protein A
MRCIAHSSLVDNTIVACGVCGLVQRVPSGAEQASVYCARCGFGMRHRKPHSLARTAALALAALILYIPANVYPVVTTQYWGAEEHTTIFDGIRGLFQTGEYPIAVLVLMTSFLFPVMKITGLLALVFTIHWDKFPRFRARAYRMIQIIGPWNMLEVYLLAIAVAIAELGRVATVHPDTGVISFACVVS